MSSLTDMQEWQVLQKQFELEADNPILKYFESGQNRFARWSHKLGGLFVDYSKHRVSDKTMQLLMDLAMARGLESSRDQMFAGNNINFTEDRAVLHIALRNQSARPIRANGEDVMPKIKQVLQRLADFTDKVRSGEWKGYSGKKITDVVNIGIGGSDLGPRMAVTALRPFVTDKLKFHFVANVDGADLSNTLKQLNPQTTLFIVESKTFSTQETLTNARTARAWLLDKLKNKDAILKHFVAVSVNRAAVKEFGIAIEHMFEFWDWVGGRYSLWSAIGLPIMLAIGSARFQELLSGAYIVDEHFRTSPIAESLPVKLAMIDIWYVNFYHAKSRAVFPYSYDLRYLPHYLQQAEMESNGKQVTREGRPVDYSTGVVSWGATGVNSQHANFQMLHQGTQLVPADFIVALQSFDGLPDHHDKLVSNCIAQTEALLCGKSEQRVREEMQRQGCPISEIDKLAPHRVFSGNRPTTTMVLDQIDPETLGSLIALYEHKIFVQGIVWDVNSFDQWGVELGKDLANTVLSELAQTSSSTTHDASTNGLIDYYKNSKAEAQRKCGPD